MVQRLPLRKRARAVRRALDEHLRPARPNMTRAVVSGRA
jgi:hypothetical protein